MMQRQVGVYEDEKPKFEIPDDSAYACVGNGRPPVGGAPPESADVDAMFDQQGIFTTSSLADLVSALQTANSMHPKGINSSRAPSTADSGFADSGFAEFADGSRVRWSRESDAVTPIHM